MDMSMYALSEDEIDDFAVEARDFAYSKGLLVRTATEPDSQDVVSHAPFTLFPSPVPKSCFTEAVAIQKDFNLLMHRVAHDYDFLKESLKRVIQVDEFTNNLWNLYETVKKEGISQPFSLGMNRSDYMFDTGVGKTTEQPPRLRQVEFNTMASGLGGLTMHVQELHKFTLTKARKLDACNYIPENNSLKGLAKAVITAWTAYNNPRAVIVFLVLKTERNMYDQRMLQYAIQQLNPEARIVRKTLKDFRERGKLSENKCLIIDSEEVAIVYQRCCYTPDHFQDKQDWDTRLLIERSKAIKCPSINYHLAGTKKIQQVLSEPGVIEKYLQDKEAIARIRATFAAQHSLDLNAEGDANAELGMKCPELYVLKPQREGGGNNIFGDEIRDKLSEINQSNERNGYILMEKIHPMSFRNYPTRSGKSVELHQMVSELGIFGTFVGTTTEVILNEDCGYLLRSKMIDSNEGGFMTGSASIDSPFLL